MKFITLALFIIVIGCNSPTHIYKGTSCSYTIDSLLAGNDSSIVKFKMDTVYEGFEVFDPLNFYGERGLYKFDRRGRLKGYYYLLNKHNDAYFGIEYDTLGNITKQTINGALRWYYKKEGNDSLTIACYLFCLNKSYNNINLKANGKYVAVDLKKKTNVSNILSFKAKLKKDFRFKSLELTAMETNTCTNEIRKFVDSSIIPYDSLK